MDRTPARHFPKPANARRHRDQIRETVNRLDDHTIDELLRRAEQPALEDGYPNTTLAEGSTGGGISNPTLAAVERRGGGQPATWDQPATRDHWRDQPDPIGDAICDLFAQLAEAAGILRIVDRTRAYVFAQEAETRGRQNTVELCAGCNQPTVKVKRLDGAPYHHPDPIGGEVQPQCWWDAYRAKRRDQEAC